MEGRAGGGVEGRAGGGVEGRAGDRDGSTARGNASERNRTSNHEAMDRSRRARGSRRRRIALCAASSRAFVNSNAFRATVSLQFPSSGRQRSRTPRRGLRHRAPNDPAAKRRPHSMGGPRSSSSRAFSLRSSSVATGLSGAARRSTVAGATCAFRIAGATRPSPSHGLDPSEADTRASPCVARDSSPRICRRRPHHANASFRSRSTAPRAGSTSIRSTTAISTTTTVREAHRLSPATES